MRDNNANVSEGRDHLLRDFSEQIGVSHQNRKDEEKKTTKTNLPWTHTGDEIHKINLKRRNLFIFVFIKSRTSLFIHIGHTHTIFMYQNLNVSLCKTCNL